MRKSRGSTTKAGTRLPAHADLPPTRVKSPAPGPSLSELKRRATERLRSISCLLAAVHAEYLAAAAECERLHAASPDSRPCLPAQNGRARGFSAGVSGLPEELGWAEPAPVASPQEDNQQHEALLANSEALTALQRRVIPTASGSSSGEHLSGLVSFLDDLAEILSRAPGSSSHS